MRPNQDTAIINRAAGENAPRAERRREKAACHAS